MKTEAEVLGLLQRLYAEMGCDPAELVRIRPLHGGWYNALIYEVVRADDAVVPIWRQDVEDANDAALTDALKAFSGCVTNEHSCPQCDQRMPAQARYCWNCGHLMPSRDGTLAANTDAIESTRRRSKPVQAALIMMTLTFAAGGAAYWLVNKPSAFDGRLVQAEAPADARTVKEVSQPSSQPRAQVTAESPSAAAQSTLDADAGAQYSKDNPQPGTRNAEPIRLQSSVPMTSQLGENNSAARARERPSKEAQSRTVRQQAAQRVPDGIDTVYKRLVAAQCATGVAGIFCRERLKFNLCKDKWTEDPPPGMTICRMPAHAAPLS